MKYRSLGLTLLVVLGVTTVIGFEVSNNLNKGKTQLSRDLNDIYAALIPAMLPSGGLSDSQIIQIDTAIAAFFAEHPGIELSVSNSFDSTGNPSGIEELNKLTELTKTASIEFGSNGLDFDHKSSIISDHQKLTQAVRAALSTGVVRVPRPASPMR